MDRVYQSNAIETPPSTVASSGSYPTAGNKASGQLATVPGPYWFYSITEEIRNAIISTGVTPDSSQVNQLALAMAKFLPLSGGTMTGPIAVSDIVAMNGAHDGTYLQFNGGTSYGRGASFEVFGANNSEAPGAFRIWAHNGASAQLLTGYPDGTLMWSGQPIACTTSTYTSGEQTVTKFSNGLMIITGLRSYAIAHNHTDSVNFAEPFVVAPSVGANGTRKGTYDFVTMTGLGDVYATGFNYICYGINTQQGSDGFSYIAIGKWK